MSTDEGPRTRPTPSASPSAPPRPSSPAVGIQFPSVGGPRIAKRPEAVRTLRSPRSEGERLGAIMRALLGHQGIRGAILARRDGTPLAADWPEPVDLESFGARHATALNAAEHAVVGKRGGIGIGIMVDLGDERILSRAIGRDLMLVAAVAPGLDWERTFLLLEAAGMDVED